MTSIRNRGKAWRALLLSVALGAVAGVAPTATAHGIGDQVKKLFADRTKEKSSDDHELGRPAGHEAAGSAVTLDQAVAQVRERHPKGEIVSAETRHTERGTLHVIKVLRADGKLKIIRIDADTGVAVK